jgi:hypothetical protein
MFHLLHGEQINGADVPSMFHIPLQADNINGLRLLLLEWISEMLDLRRELKIVGF